MTQQVIVREFSRSALALAVCAAFAGAQAQEPPGAVQVPSAALPTVALPTVTVPPELDRVLRDYERAWMQKQPSALAALFTAQGMALHHGSPPARGAAQIAARYAEAAGSTLSPAE